MERIITKDKIGELKCAIVDVAATQAITNAALCFGNLIWSAPKGIITINSIHSNVTIVSSGTQTADPEMGFGTVVGDDSANATIEAADATMEDWVDGVSIGALTSTTAKEYGDTVWEMESPNTMDGSTTAKKVHLNFAGTFTAAQTLTITGTVKIYYTVIAD